MVARSSRAGGTSDVESIPLKEDSVMPRLTSFEREDIIRRRGTKSDKTGNKSRIDSLQVHHKDRDQQNNDPRNLRVLTKKEHKELHNRTKR